MFKSLKKVLVGVLASSLVLSSVVFAAGSATDAPAAKEFSKAARKATVTVAKDVTVVNAGAFNKKNVNVKFASKKAVTVKKNAFKNAKKLKTITVYKNKVTFKKGAFGKLNTSKMTIKVKGLKKNSKAFKNYKDALKKAGFKGTVKVVK